VTRPLPRPWRRFTLEPHDDGALEQATHAFAYRVPSPLGPAATFAFLSEIASDAEWFPDFVDGAWESAAPHGVGSTRWFRSDLLWLRERFVAWTPGERFAFIGTETTLPLMRRFAEDYRFTPTPSGGTEVTWRILYTPRAVFRPLHPLLRPVFAKMFQEAATAMEAALAREAGRGAAPGSKLSRAGAG